MHGIDVTSVECLRLQADSECGMFMTGDVDGGGDGVGDDGSLAWILQNDEDVFVVWTISSGRVAR
jgi:hypothetical protein